MKPHRPDRLWLWELSWRGLSPLLGFSNLAGPRFWKNLKHSRVFDCFTFFNELAVLEIRLEELQDVVDYFVLVEATRTHSGKEKPLYFHENRGRFDRFKDKIIHVVIDDMPEVDSKTGSRWRLENHQRNGILRGLIDCKDSDVILISDADEIPNPAKFGQLMLLLGAGAKSVCFRQKFFFYYLNGLKKNAKWNGSVGTYYKTLIGAFKQPQQIRDSRGLYPSPLIERGGWHFSYLGGAESIAHKIHSFAHEEYDAPQYADARIIAEKMRTGEDLFGQDARLEYVRLDGSFPKTIIRDPERFRELLRPVPLPGMESSTR